MSLWDTNRETASRWSSDVVTVEPAELLPASVSDGTAMEEAGIVAACLAGDCVGWG